MFSPHQENFWTEIKHFKQPITNLVIGNFSARSLYNSWQISDCYLNFFTDQCFILWENMKILSTQMSRYWESPEINVCANEPYAPGLKDTERVFHPVSQFS